MKLPEHGLLKAAIDSVTQFTDKANALLGSKCSMEVSCDSRAPGLCALKAYPLAWGVSNLMLTSL